ncbi:hypothetical protein HYPSUDRAFT_145387 [Hypholoma sublateritium FD-334 SS-4]|uniref:Uncharacterized protein n=1 Tax=Hypholoma sublateritium (strain FD-334 SS-4) TaxID=945553 RepID=A0A0D2NN50_HYPSF|nr:hypothetical protein HYPSUDRAFT_145387 [Hypholoma sublateritium FD-334 SS-4]
MPPKPSSLLSTITNNLKPHKAEAIQRIRFNTLCLVATLILSYLLPAPSLLVASRTVFRGTNHQTWSVEWFKQWFAFGEVSLVALLGYNIVEAAFAIKYPRAPLAPIASPAKPRTQASSLATPKRAFKILSPHTTPQAQKPFAFSPSASTSLGSSVPYAQSPISTPSRVLHYSALPSSSTTTQSSSTSDFLATPSPVISAYRGKHISAEIGRALDGSYLSRIMQDDTTDD